MDEILKIIGSVLEDASYTHFVVDDPTISCVGFENDLSLGFVYSFQSTEGLLENWKSYSENILSRFQFQLRSAGDKSWNVYSVFLSVGSSTEQQNSLMGRIEEDLSGTRKIMRAVVPDVEGVRSGLLPLLRIQNPPILGPVDMIEEISVRASGLPTKAVEAFLHSAPNSEILRLMGRSDEA